MNLVVNDPYTTKDFVEKFGGKYIENLDDFWALPDFITVHTPKTPETTHMINEKTIAKMKDGVRLVNCARGGIIDENDLKAALDSGKVASCAIDVFEDEKNIQDCVLRNFGKNVLLTPHLGASTSEAQINVALDVAEQVKEVLSGGNATSAVNIPSLKPQKLEPVKDYMSIAENIAQMAAQISKGNLKNVEIEVKGTLADLDVSPLEVAILKGVLSNKGALSSILVGVNYVNAPLIAKGRGIDVTVKKSQQSTDYIGSITVKLNCDKESAEVSGAMIAEHIKPEKFMLLVPHVNKPGMIAQVATVLGTDNVNISRMQVVQKSFKKGAPKTDEKSMMIINTDNEVNKETLDKIAKIDGIYEAEFVKLNV